MEEQRLLPLLYLRFLRVTRQACDQKVKDLPSPSTEASVSSEATVHPVTHAHPHAIAAHSVAPSSSGHRRSNSRLQATVWYSLSRDDDRLTLVAGIHDESLQEADQYDRFEQS